MKPETKEQNPDTSLKATGDLQVDALFLGPKSENRDYFRQILDFLIEEHMHWRRNFHPEDRTVTEPRDRRSEDYQITLDRTTEVLLELSSKLKQTSMPGFSAGYLGHMNSDTLMVANLACMATTLYNPNNCAYEASTATTPMEIEAGEDMATMLGYDPATSWGHITCDGTIANYEGLWLARNLKSFPLAVKKIHPDLVQGLGEWELLNLPVPIILYLIDKVKAADVFDEVRNESARGNGAGTGKLGVVLVPQSKHYSWVKAADVLGIGQKNLVAVQVDNHYHMDVGILRETIESYIRQQIPILAVVGVLGTTEEGAIDKIDEIAALRDEYEKKGISFYFHVDAAYGGYSRSLFLDEDSQFIGYDKLCKRLKDDGIFVHESSWPSKDIYEAYKAVPSADSITIDPHKMGYIPYAAGGIAIKDKMILDLISYFAAYVFEPGEGDAPTLLGSYIMEGSKSGAMAASVLVAHRVIPLNITGYGQIIGRSIEGAQMFSKALERTKTIKVAGREFLLEPLVEAPDFNIVIMALNEKGNTNLEIMNALNEKIYDEASYVSGPVFKNDWITSKTDLSYADYGDAPKEFTKRLGIPAEEWDRVKSVYVLRLCMLNLFIAHAQHLDVVWNTYLDILKEKLDEIIRTTTL